MIRSALIVGCVALLAAQSAPAQDAPLDRPLDRNAALSYWQAFALTPAIDEALRKSLGKAASSVDPIDNELRELVKSSENALTYMHRGARIEPCAWGLAYETGPYAMLPHLTKARDLARIALLRARIRFESNRPDEAIADIVAATTLARHAGQEGVIVLISILVDYAIEAQAVETIAHYLPSLQRSERQSLWRKLQDLPEPIGMKKALIGEKQVFLPWLIREVESNGSERISDLAGDVTGELIRPIESQPKSQLVKWAKGLDAIYDAGAEFAALSPDQAKRKQEEFDRRLQDKNDGNPLGLLFLPAFARARQLEAVHLTRGALLEAAFAILRDGDEARSRPEHRDPFGDGPFQLRKTDDGFELASQLIHNDGPVTLQAGRAR